MFRCAKYLVAVLGLVVVGGFVVWGSSFPSYIRTSARAVKDSVQEQVPIEFELRRARDMIENILPELQGQVRTIAQEEVAISALKRDINQSQTRLHSEETTLTALREKMRVQQVVYLVNHREITRPQLTEQIARRFDRFKQGQLAQSSKEKLLAKRQAGLSAAVEALDAMKHRKIELEQKVEMLAAQAQTLKASQHQAGIVIDGSQLSEADELLSEIETRLAVAQRVLSFEKEMETQTWSDEIVDEEQVLLEFDRYFEDNDVGEPKPTRLVEINKS